MIDAATLMRFAPRARDADVVAPALEKARSQSTVNTHKRLAHFMGQVYVETAGFTVMQENLNYRDAQRLDKIFSAVKGVEDAKVLIEKGAAAIANRVYANRLGNGDEKSGDGWKYRGSGYLQLTGRANYKSIGATIGIDLVADPELVRAPESASRVARRFCVLGCGRLLNVGRCR